MESPIKKLINEIDGSVKWLPIASVAILVGVFVNFIFSLKYLFSPQEIIHFHVNIYFVSASIIIGCYLYFVIRCFIFIRRWEKMKGSMPNGNIIIYLAIPQEIVKKYLADFLRIISLLIFVFLIINHRIPLEVNQLSGILPQTPLFISGGVLFILVILAIEWPSLLLVRHYRRWRKVMMFKDEEPMSF